MIDLAVPVDTSSLLNFSQYVQNAGKETFRYIFFDNFDYISKLHNSGKMRDVIFDNIQKTILCSSIYLGYDLYECPYCGQGRLSSLIPALPDSAPNAVLKLPSGALLLFLLWLSNLSIVTLFSLFLKSLGGSF